LLLGWHIEQYQLLRKDYLRLGKSLIHKVTGGRVEAIQRRGKIIAIHLDNNISLLHHLGMSGRLLCCPIKEPATKHIHLRVPMQGKDIEMRQSDPRRFGYTGLIESSRINEFEPWGKMGKDPFQLKVHELLNIFDSRVRPIKALLLEQHLIGGMGNIYVDESLFRACIHPMRPAREILEDEARRLLSCMRKVLNESINAGGSSTSDFQKLDGTLGAFQHKHRVYKRDGMPCRHCKKPIQKTVLGGRSTHFCPQCQK